jgi:hypothetical protein
LLLRFARDAAARFQLDEDHVRRATGGKACGDTGLADLRTPLFTPRRR